MTWFAAAPMVQPPTEFAGQEKVWPPEASWVIWKKITLGGMMATKLKGWAEALPVSVISNN